MKRAVLVLFMIMLGVNFAYTAVTVSIGEYKKVYKSSARFGIDADEDVIIESNGMKIVVPKGQKVIVRADVNEKGETIISISGSSFKDINVNGYDLSSNEKSFFTINAKTGEILVVDGYLTIKDPKGHMLFAAKNVPFTIDLTTTLNTDSPINIIKKISNEDEKRQEIEDLSPSAPR
ncbi:MAG: hypothetical protein PHR82_02695 [Endomicrobiaceae bacterium]|nr:hypothetical protein [Endomicrobiaceae bacterium]